MLELPFPKLTAARFMPSLALDLGIVPEPAATGHGTKNAILALTGHDPRSLPARRALENRLFERGITVADYCEAELALLRQRLPDHHQIRARLNIREVGTGWYTDQAIVFAVPRPRVNLQRTGEAHLEEVLEELSGRSHMRHLKVRGFLAPQESLHYELAKPRSKR